MTRLEITETLSTGLINANASQYAATFKITEASICYKLSYIGLYIALCSTDSHWSVSLKGLETNIIWLITFRMLKCHPITAFMKTHANIKNILDKGFFV